MWGRTMRRRAVKGCEAAAGLPATWIPGHMKPAASPVHRRRHRTRLRCSGRLGGAILPRLHALEVVRLRSGPLQAKGLAVGQPPSLHSLHGAKMPPTTIYASFGMGLIGMADHGGQSHELENSGSGYRHPQHCHQRLHCQEQVSGGECQREMAREHEFGQFLPRRDVRPDGSGGRIVRHRLLCVGIPVVG